jgi:hypothetical protein
MLRESHLVNSQINRMTHLGSLAELVATPWPESHGLLLQARKSGIPMLGIVARTGTEYRLFSNYSHWPYVFRPDSHA